MKDHHIGLDNAKVVKNNLGEKNYLATKLKNGEAESKTHDKVSEKIEVDMGLRDYCLLR